MHSISTFCLTRAREHLQGQGRVLVAVAAAVAVATVALVKQDERLGAEAVLFVGPSSTCGLLSGTVYPWQAFDPESNHLQCRTIAHTCVCVCEKVDEGGSTRKHTSLSLSLSLSLSGSLSQTWELFPRGKLGLERL